MLSLVKNPRRSITVKGAAMAFKRASIFTQQLYDFIRKTLPGEIVTYAAMAELIGMPVQAGKSTAGYGYLMTARNMCLNNDEIVFRPVINEGLEHIVDQKKGDVGYKVIKGLRRQSRKGIKEISTVKDFDSLSNTEMVMHNSARTVLGMFELCTRPKKIVALQGAVEQAGKTISAKETIKLFE